MTYTQSAIDSIFVSSSRHKELISIIEGWLRFWPDAEDKEGYKAMVKLLKAHKVLATMDKS